MRRLVISASAALLIVSCQRETQRAQTPPTATPAATTTKPQDLGKAKVDQKIEMNAADALTDSHLGSTTGADGRVNADKKAFKAGEPIIVSLALRDAPKGVILSARWYDTKNKQMAEDKKVLTGEKSATFTWPEKKKLKPGKYRVVTYWGENIAAEHPFEVTK